MSEKKLYSNIKPIYCNKKWVKLLLLIFVNVAITQECSGTEAYGPYELSPWKVGQFAEYQVITIEDQGEEDIYRLSIESLEKHEDRDYFWIRLDIFREGKRILSFRALVNPMASREFAEEPAFYISEGILSLFKNAKKVLIISEDGESYEISKDVLFEPENIFEGTMYKALPEYKNKVDYTKMKVFSSKEKILTNTGEFSCYHFQIKTTKYDAYTDEGIDLWRSEKVPFLGIVRLEFSKSDFRSKYNYRYYEKAKDKGWMQKLKLKRINDRDRKDTYLIKLINYGIYRKSRKN